MKHGLIAHGRIGKNYDHGWHKINEKGSCDGFRAKPPPKNVDGD